MTAAASSPGASKGDKWPTPGRMMNSTHWRYGSELQRRFPKVRVNADRIFVKGGHVWTSAGITSGIDLTLALIEDDFGIEVSKAVARDIVVYHRASLGPGQRRAEIRTITPA